MKTFIYGLCDPETNEIRYIGKSNQPKKRLQDHIYSCERTVTHKNNWIKSLLNKKYELRPTNDYYWILLGADQTLHFLTYWILLFLLYGI